MPLSLPPPAYVGAAVGTVHGYAGYGGKRSSQAMMGDSAGTMSAQKVNQIVQGPAQTSAERHA